MSKCLRGELHFCLTVSKNVRGVFQFCLSVLKHLWGELQFYLSFCKKHAIAVIYTLCKLTTTSRIHFAKTHHLKIEIFPEYRKNCWEVKYNFVSQYRKDWELKYNFVSQCREVWEMEHNFVSPYRKIWEVNYTFVSVLTINFY